MKLAWIKQIVAPTGHGSILVIAGLLLGSATIRLAMSTSAALAQSGQLPTEPAPTGNVESGTLTKNDSQLAVDPVLQAPDSDTPIDRGEISGLITALTEREAQVAKREKKLEMRMRALSVADEEIEKRMASLAETERALRETLSLADQASEKDILRLTTVYESMKPKDAAALFEQMEPAFAAGFLGRMRPDAAANVMAGLSPEAAYSISVILAGRNANVPKT